MRHFAIFCIFFVIVAAQLPIQLPPFTPLAHGVSSGYVTLLDKRRVLIENFKYDGAGPDAYFVVGKGTTPSATGRIIQNELGSSDVLRGYIGENIELTLPADLTWNDVDYLSIYCVAFRENFGHVLIPSGLSLPEYA